MLLYITGYNPTTYAHMYTQFPSSVELLINCVSVWVCYFKVPNLM